MRHHTKTECGNPDTRSRQGTQRSVCASLRKLLVLLLLGVGACASRSVTGGPAVVWVSHPRVYVATPDSTAFALGDTITIEKDGRMVAGGAVTRLQGEVATVTLSQGSLAGEADLSQLEVKAAAPAGPTLMRVGVPSPRRSTPLFTCAPRIRAPWAEGAYRTDTLSERAYRLIRDPSRAGGDAWPETLLVRLFDKAVDQEIALERAEIDVAVFWPGEMPAPMRERGPWQGSPSGVRARGVVALVWLAPPGADSIRLADPVRRTFAAFDRDLFRGDLLPLWNGHEIEVTEARIVWAPDDARSQIRIDPTVPGRVELQRYLDRVHPSGAAAAPVARLVYLDAPVTPRDSLRSRAVEALRNGRFDPALERAAHEDQVLPLFAIRCPVVCAPRWRRAVRVLGADALVDLLDCGSGSAR